MSMMHGEDGGCRDAEDQLRSILTEIGAREESSTFKSLKQNEAKKDKSGGVLKWVF